MITNLGRAGVAARAVIAAVLAVIFLCASTVGLRDSVAGVVPGLAVFGLTSTVWSACLLLRATRRSTKDGGPDMALIERSRRTFVVALRLTQALLIAGLAIGLVAGLAQRDWDTFGACVWATAVVFVAQWAVMRGLLPAIQRAAGWPVVAYPIAVFRRSRLMAPPGASHSDQPPTSP